jgi:Fe-S-cluster-containing hydrogenase component 2
MILSRNLYSKINVWKSWWFRRQLRNISGENLFKVFNLHRTKWPEKLYFYSPRLKRMPVFIGNAQLLSQWHERKICETICPTKAIEVRSDEIHIDQAGCIGCGLCIEFAPPGLLKMVSDPPE